MTHAKKRHVEHLPLTKKEERANQMPCAQNFPGNHEFAGRMVIEGVTSEFADRCKHCDLTAGRLVR